MVSQSTQKNNVFFRFPSCSTIPLSAERSTSSSKHEQSTIQTRHSVLDITCMLLQWDCQCFCYGMLDAYGQTTSARNPADARRTQNRADRRTHQGSSRHPAASQVQAHPRSGRHPGDSKSGIIQNWTQIRQHPKSVRNPAACEIKQNSSRIRDMAEIWPHLRSSRNPVSIQNIYIYIYTCMYL